MRSLVVAMLVTSTMLNLVVHFDPNTGNIVRGQVVRRRRLRYNNNNGRRNQVRRGSAYTVSRVGRWTDGVIYYQIGGSLQRYRAVIKQAFDRIEAQTCIRFEQRQNQRDFVQLINGNGCHSKVGRAGGRQILSLGEGCHNVGSAIHELCHAIGLYHEHMRYDRDRYLQIVWRNIQPSMRSQFEKVSAAQYRPAADFDFNSIMIYGSRAFSKNRKVTMVPRVRGARIRESHYKRDLSRGDVININRLYECA